MKIHIVNHMVNGIQVHRAGCQDIQREIKRGRTNSNWEMEIADDADPATEVAASISEDFGWPDNYPKGEPAPWLPTHINTLPCLKK